MPLRFNWELIGGLVALAGAVLLGILVMELVRRWVRKSATQSPTEELGHFRRLLDQGLLTPEEFARVESSVQQRDLPPMPAEAPSPREERFFDASARDKVRAPAPPTEPARPAADENDGSSLPS